ncbi:MAG: ribonuclease P protein component [Victivallales bacterium]|nr:ribonuclease P protein component [Victivallales bacterium]MCF7889263.1 ribonuclease P protein component [Victivallales bacterium]
MTVEKKKLPVQYGIAKLKKDNRLKLKSQFENARLKGNKFVGKFFILITVNKTEELKYGVICSRKFDRNAVVRNKTRRLLRESFRLIKNQIINAHLIFIPRQRIKSQRLQQVQTEMIMLLKKAGLWKEPKKK